jgi:hypothetical protein
VTVGSEEALEYTRGNLKACPEESFFHHYVAAQFGGEDPFSATAKGKITLSLSRQGRAFAATLAMYDEPASAWAVTSFARTSASASWRTPASWSSSG